MFPLLTAETQSALKLALKHVLRVTVIMNQKRQVWAWPNRLIQNNMTAKESKYTSTVWNTIQWNIICLHLMYKPHSTMVLSQYIFIREVKISTKYKTFNTKHNRDNCQVILKYESDRKQYHKLGMHGLHWLDSPKARETELCCLWRLLIHLPRELQC